MNSPPLISSEFMKNKRYVVIVVLLAIFLLEVVILYIWAYHKKTTLRNEYELKMKIRQLNHEKEKRKLNEEFEEKRYFATGKDVYERIYNRQEKDITDLLDQLSKESFSDDWKTEIKVEEFVNFLLLVQYENTPHRPNIKEVMSHLVPIVIYGRPYLRNVAVFDKEHRCYLFFDENALEELNIKKTLNGWTIADIEKKGRMFTRYNSIKINFKKENGHIFVPVTVYGEYGFYESIMMLDTGASMTVISSELAMKTGREDLNKVERRTFSTPKGSISCPIVERKVLVGDVEKKQLVAVNPLENTNLLGVDFFEDKNYIIDEKSNCIFLWSK